jgi:tetratricopeptide (TPR) repeat protein
MRAFILAGAACAAVTCAAFAQDQEMPSACRYDAQQRIDYEACAAASAPGSATRRLSLINLGSQAFLRQDYAAAVRYYDEAQPPGGQDTLYSDASFHAFRAGAYDRVGRADEALANAKIALGLVTNSPSLPEAARDHFAMVNVDVEEVYVFILPILKRGAAPEFGQARDAYLALPLRDWTSAANRAAVLEQLEDYDAALRMNALALQAEPNHPAVLNNQCYILTRASRAEEALPFCARAVALAGDVAAVRHSNAAALGAAGRCAASERELAIARQLDPVSVEYRQPIACSPARP